MFGVYLPTYPIMIRANEGLVWNLLTTLGVAGRLAIYFELEWDEVAANMT